MATVSPMLLVRMLTVNQFGIFRQILFVEGVVLTFIMMRVPQNLYYFFPRTNGRHRELLSQAVSMLTFTSAFGVLAFYVGARFFGFIPDGISEEYLLPLALYVLVESISSILDQIFVLEKRSTTIPVLSAGSQVLRLGLIIGAALIFQSVLAIVYAMCCYSFVRLVYMLAYLVKRYSIRFGISDRTLFREQLIYGIPLAGATIVSLIGNQFEKGVISALMSPEDFAMYSIGGLGAMYAISLIYTSMGDVAVPRFGELAVSGDLAGIKTLWHRIVSINSLVTIPVVIFAWIFAELIISFLFTAKYIASATVWRVNLFILIFQMLAYGYIPTAMGKTRAIFLGNSIRAAMVVPISYIMVLKFGIVGGGIAFVAGFWVNGLIQLYASKQAINLPFRELLPWRRLLTITTISIIPALLVSHTDRLGLSTLTTLLIAGSVYFSLVTVAFWWAGYLNVQELRHLFAKSRGNASTIVKSGFRIQSQ